MYLLGLHDRVPEQSQIVTNLVEQLKNGNYSAAPELYALGLLRDPSSVEAIGSVLADSTHQFSRWVALDALKRIGTPEALAIVEQWQPKRT